MTAQLVTNSSLIEAKYSLREAVRQRARMVRKLGIQGDRPLRGLNRALVEITHALLQR